MKFLVQNKSCFVLNSQHHVLISMTEDDGTYEIIDIIALFLLLCLLLHCFCHFLTSHENNSSVTWKSKGHDKFLFRKCLKPKYISRTISVVIALAMCQVCDVNSPMEVEVKTIDIRGNCNNVCSIDFRHT